MQSNGESTAGEPARHRKGRMAREVEMPGAPARVGRSRLLHLDSERHHWQCGGDDAVDISQRRLQLPNPHRPYLCGLLIIGSTVECTATEPPAGTRAVLSRPCPKPPCMLAESLRRHQHGADGSKIPGMG